MQKLLVTAALALGLSSTAFANTGNIQFKGAITSGTCSIEIIDPVTGGKMDNVRMGNVASGRFNTIGDEGNSHPFAMRVTPGTGCDIQETETVYHEIPNVGFEYQLNNFQQPYTVTQRWRLESDSTALREEVTTTEYDPEHGNLILEEQPNGIVTTYAYYDKDGEDGCPPDPHACHCTGAWQTATAR